MSDMQSGSGADAASAEQSAKEEAVEYVVEEAKSWHSGAPEDTVREKLDEGFAQAEVDVPEEKIDELARDIHAGEEPDTTGAVS